MKKRLLIFITFIICISILNVNASTNTFERTNDNLLVPSKVEVTEDKKQSILATPAVDAKEKIYDFADLFTDSEEQMLYDEVSKYIETYNYDLAIVTINKNNKVSEINYADDFYDYNDFKEDGVLFLIDMDNRQLHMTTTGDAIKMYNDYRIDESLDAVASYMTDKNYYKGTSDYIEHISNYAKGGYPSNDKEKKEITISQAILYSVIGSIIVTIIVIIVLIRKNKLVRKATTAMEYLNKDKTNIKHVSDKFMGSNTVRHKISHDSDSGGGSSTHSGSSGISHGGGSHGF